MPFPTQGWSRSLTGPPLALLPATGHKSRQLDTGLQVCSLLSRWVLAWLVPKNPRMPRPAVVWWYLARVATGRSKPGGGVLWGKLAISSATNMGHRIWPPGALFPRPVARAGLMGAGDSGCPGREGPGQPGDQAQTCQATPSVPPLPGPRTTDANGLASPPLPYGSYHGLTSGKPRECRHGNRKSHLRH
jgi:hypothetical protein